MAEQSNSSDGKPWLWTKETAPKGGRPKGARNKLGEAFVADLYESWQEHGKAAIIAVLATKPSDYLKVVASLLPKQVEIKETAFDGISETDLAALIVAARSALDAPQGSGGGTEGAGGNEPPEGLSSVH